MLTLAGQELARVPCPQGAPQRPVSPADLARKLADLSGGRLNGLLDDRGIPAGDVLDAAGQGRFAERLRTLT